ISAGIALALLYVIYIAIMGLLKPESLPTVSSEEDKDVVRVVAVVRCLVLPIILIGLVLGSILTGAATPTEGAAIGVVGTLLLALASRRLKWSMLTASLWSTIKTSSMILWILAGAAGFSGVFAGVGGMQLMTRLAEAAPGGRWGVLIFAIVFIFVLGMFLETMAL